MRHERERENCAELKNSLNSANDKDLKDSSNSNSTDSTDSSKPHDSLSNYKKLNYELLSDDEKREGYVFHILSDKVSEDSRQKLDKLAIDLSKIYPCEIEIHICDDSIFDGLPKWLGNYTAYYRLFIPQFMPKNLKTCLYLDVDMLAFRDLRKLWTLDLTDKIVGAIKDRLSWFNSGLYSKKSSKKIFMFDNFFFSSGFLLINLSEWKAQKITKQSLDFVANYEVTLPDQDALNAIIGKTKTLILPFEYNILVDAYINILESKEFRIFTFDYSKQEISYALDNPIIFHFINGCKPWESKHIFCDKHDKPLMLYWWQIAWSVPYFSDELRRIFATKRDNYLVCKDFGLYVANLINKCSQSLAGYLKMPFVVWSAFRDFDLKRDYAADLGESIDKNVAFELMSVATRAWGKKSKLERIFKFIVLPLRIYRVKKHCAKGIFKAQKGNKIFTLYAE